MANLISASSAPIAGFEDKEYYDLLGTIKVMKNVFQESVVDGFELQLEPEWDNENPPLSKRNCSQPKIHDSARFAKKA